MTSDPLSKNKPRRLVPGDTFGIVAPSSPFDKKKFQQGLFFIEELGFKVFCPEPIFEQKQYLAGSDALRAKTLTAMFADPGIKGIICARGGYGALRILSLIDFDVICANPKVFIGSSDITVLLNTLLKTCGLVSLHAPMVESLSRASERTKQAFSDILSNHQKLTNTLDHPVIINAGQASGVMAGGNLTTLCHMVGTPFEPDFTGQILLLEDVGEAPYRIDRMLTQMKLAGCFEQIKGIALGTFTGCGAPDLVYRIFKDIFSSDHLPIVAGFDIGHGEPNLPIPFGIRAALDSKSGAISFEAPLFR